MAVPRALAVCLALMACERTPAPVHERKPDPRFVIRAEASPPSTGSHSEDSFVCDYDPAPMVYLMKDSLGLDGMFWMSSSQDGEIELRNILQNRRVLEAKLDNPPKRELWMQIDEDVPKARVKRIKALVHHMGYYDVQVVPRPAPRSKPAAAASN